MADKFSRYYVGIYKGCLTFLFLLITILMFSEVVLRYVFQSPIFGIEELCILLAMWLYFIGLGYATYDRNHITVDILPVLTKNQRDLRICDLLALLLSLVATGVVVYLTSKYCLFVYGRREITTTYHFSRLWVLVPSVIGSVLMFLHFLVELLQKMGILQQKT
ncbi:MAG: TRAP transporter small permease subunit [Dehalococcoidia bacterium]|nr:MAG: TRAP transporter small permease subunit [Dehalococcoidia bacterium]